MKFNRIRVWIGENKIRAALVIVAALLLLILLVDLLLVNIGIGRLSYEADDTEPVIIDPAFAAGNGIYFPEIETIRKPGVINVLFLGTDFAIGEEGSRGRRGRGITREGGQQHALLSGYPLRGYPAGFL